MFRVWHRLRRCALSAALAVAAGGAALPVAAQQAEPSTARAERPVGEWLMRMHDASRLRNYVGTFVVLSAQGGMSSSRIWHACEGDMQIERVEALTGPARSTFRRNDEVVTFLPVSRVAVMERRESLAMFPGLLQAGDNAIADFYAAKLTGNDRVAGFDADVVQIAPRDALRFGYRIWSDRKTGLVLKLQTIDGDGNVLEQAAFSELQLDAPVRPDRLAQMMGNTDGYRVERPELQRTTAAAEGWSLKAPVAGFKPMSCFRRPAGSPEGTVQWIFSDGLAAVSLFVEPFDRQRHAQERVVAMGATYTLTRRLGEWWLTAVGEVPLSTLKSFAQNIERRR